jgi:hypothetical protein
MLSAVALVIVVRRWAGALGSPLGPAALLTTGALVAAAAAAIRLAWFQTPGGRRTPWRDRMVMLSTLLTVFAVGFGLSVPGTGFPRLLFFALLAIEEGCTWAWYLGRTTGCEMRRTGCQPVPQDHDSPETGWQPVLQDDLPPSEVVQQLTRSRAADGARALPVGCGSRLRPGNARAAST